VTGISGTGHLVYSSPWSHHQASPARASARRKTLRRNTLPQLLQVVEYLVAHDVPILTASYLLRSHDAWVRRGELAPVSHEDPLAAWRVSRGLSGAHRATVAKVLAQLSAAEQARED
jgi:hypothetical protein